MFRNLLGIKKLSPPMLGRWNPNNNPNIKSILANYDNCGDSICKDPVEVQKYIDYEVLKIKEEENRKEEEKNKNLIKKSYIFY